jgi:hypothetical protein
MRSPATEPSAQVHPNMYVKRTHTRVRATADKRTFLLQGMYSLKDESDPKAI